MILKNAKIYSEGLIRKGVIHIEKGLIKTIYFNPQEDQLTELTKKKSNQTEIDCQNRLILPGIIDIHSHLRDMDQSNKETFLTGTKAAAFSGITTVFNMPNTIPPAITQDQIKLWMKKAKNNIFIDVGFIAGVPEGMDEEIIKKILMLGVFGFKIYPLNSINDIDWTDKENIFKILNISSKYQIPIFIHASYPLPKKERDQIIKEFKQTTESILEYHNRLDPEKSEEKFVKLIIECYYEFINKNKSDPKLFPIIHFCHISCIESYSIIKKTQETDLNFNITFEVTPHHLLLSNKIRLDNDNFGKVLPPLREEKHPKFLFDQLKAGNIKLIGTDHAPHTLEEKNQNFFKAPSGFPGFETYPLLLLDKVFNFQLSLERFVEVSSEHPAKIFNLKKKGFIKEGYYADLYIVEKIPKFLINPKNFKTKSKFSPFKDFKSSVEIWKVFLKGHEINIEDAVPKGKIFKKILKNINS
ncbi:MAG: dihydroorotase family protein [Candidatus Thorarchaeota archaeon]